MILFSTLFFATLYHGPITRNPSAISTTSLLIVLPFFLVEKIPFFHSCGSSFGYCVTPDSVIFSLILAPFQSFIRLLFHQLLRLPYLTLSAQQSYNCQHVQIVIFTCDLTALQLLCSTTREKQTTVPIKINKIYKSCS